MCLKKSDFISCCGNEKTNIQINIFIARCSIHLLNVFFPCRVMGRVLEPVPAVRGGGHCWTAPQLIAGPDLSIWGSGTLLKGTPAVLWRCPGTSLATFSTFVCKPGIDPRTLRLLGSVPCRLELPPPDAQSELHGQNEHMGCWKTTSRLCGAGETQTSSCSVSKSTCHLHHFNHTSNRKWCTSAWGLLSSRIN